MTQEKETTFTELRNPDIGRFRDKGMFPYKLGKD